MRNVRGRNATDALAYFPWEPTPVQLGLIDVSLSAPESIAERWSSFTARFASDTRWIPELDWGTRRLLPLVGWQLAVAGVDDSRAQQVRRDTAGSMWVSRVRAKGYADVLTVLTDAGVDPLVLKGVGLASLVYPDVGCRPSSDLDVYVGPEGYQRTFDALAPIGRSVPPGNGSVVPRVRHSRNAVVAGHSVDIHWRLLSDRYDLTPDEGLRSRSVAFELADRPVRTLGLEDHLVHSLAHGLRPSYVSPVRWVVDSALIIRTGDLRWDVFSELVRERRVGSSVARGLTVLRERFHIEVPSDVISELAADDGALWNRVEDWSRRVHPLWIQRCLSQYVVKYGLGSHNWPLSQKLRGYGEFISPVYRDWRSRRSSESVAAAAGMAMPHGMEWLS